MADLIPRPDLDLRDEDRLAAEAIAYVSGGLTVERIDSQINVLLQLRELTAGGLDQPICPELTNASSSSPHTVILEAQAYLVGQIARRINSIPLRDQIEFARLFGIELRTPEVAKTVLTFTVNPPPGVDVTIAEGTEVSSVSGEHKFVTDEDLVIPAGLLTGAVSATCETQGHLILAANTITEIDDPIAFVDSVANADPINDGLNQETISEALIRARAYQRRGERLVSAQDFEDAIRDDVLLGKGIVRAFPFIVNGDWENPQAGHTTIVAMNSEGDNITDAEKQAINELLSEAVGNQFIYVLDPIFIDFTIAAEIEIEELVSEVATAALAKKNLLDFYAARNGKFGIPALRSEIIAVIEGTVGVKRIVPQVDGSILSSPVADIAIAPYELVRLGEVDLTVV